MLEEDRIIKIDIENEMKSAYIDYSMSVIVSRALPDVRDGLKPVHRRVLFGMNEMGNNSDKAYKKAANAVGEVMGKYHPHGDSSIYGTIVRMAQWWAMREKLVDGHGNFGSIDGDGPAAMRYTEIRLEKMGEEMLRVEHFSGEGFADVTFTARRGQIIGLTGLKGCGSSELMQGLFGIHHPSGGNVEVCGKKLHGGSIHEAMGAGIAMLPADRKENSVIPDMSLLENMYLSEHVLSARSFAINTKRENERFEKYGKLLNIKANSSADNINSLSGGNQQKVFLARWLNTDAQVLLLDNPTQGIDVGAKSEIYHLILDLARKGKTVIINTLEIPELREVADVCYVLYEGRVVKELAHDEINEQTVMLYSTNSAA